MYTLADVVSMKSINTIHMLLAQLLIQFPVDILFANNVYNLYELLILLLLNRLASITGHTDMNYYFIERLLLCHAAAIEAAILHTFKTSRSRMLS